METPMPTRPVPGSALSRRAPELKWFNLFSRESTRRSRESAAATKKRSRSREPLG
jgi:hypothetical protein